MSRIIKCYKDKIVNKCSECDYYEKEQETTGLEAYTHNCRTNHIKHICTNNDFSLGDSNWIDGKWVGTFTDSIPEKCSLPKKKEIV